MSKFHEFFLSKYKHFIEQNVFVNVVCKMSAILFRLQCVTGLTRFTCWYITYLLRHQDPRRVPPFACLTVIHYVYHPSGAHLTHDFFINNYENWQKFNSAFIQIITESSLQNFIAHVSIAVVICAKFVTIWWPHLKIWLFFSRSWNGSGNWWNEPKD